MQYPARLAPDKTDGGYVVTFRDIPEAITQGDTEEEALYMAADALLTSMDFYFDAKRMVPLPSKAKRGERLVSLPPSIVAKVLLLNEMLSQNVRPSDLARRMSTTPQVINKIIDLRGSTKIDQVAQAIEALGRELDVRLV